MDESFDLLVLGSGVAGLSAAIRAAAGGLRVAILTKGETGHSATRYAQGGIAASFHDDDSTELHLSDTLAAGGGLCDPEATRTLVTEGPQRVRELMAAGAVFDRTGDGDAAALALAQEGGHSTARVIHAGGDATGAEIERALVSALDAAGVDVREGWFVLDLLVASDRCAGVTALDARGNQLEIRARNTLMASGGAGQLYSLTTNPPPSTGDGTAMALRAGVPVADLEFMQFHPTALVQMSIPRPLLSEALRGEGAVLRDERGVGFMAGEHPLADLAPRDVVARAITVRLIERGVDHLWLDATGIEDFAMRFPTIHRACREAGLDPSHDWLPVAPAAHYHCGGILTDLDGAAGLGGLWAVGEAACTGAHGANRLASNSLLEGLVFAARAVGAIVAGKDAWEPSGAVRGLDLDAPAPSPTTIARTPAATTSGPNDTSPRSRDDSTVETLRSRVQEAMTSGAGVVRSEASLTATADGLASVMSAVGVPSSVDAWEVRNLATVGAALCRSATSRRESRGAHTREEFSDPDRAFHGRFVHFGVNEMAFVPLVRAESSVW